MTELKALPLTEAAKFFRESDLEINGKQIAYILENFDPRTECYHLRVKIERELYRAQTLEEPAEYIEWGVCCDCGENIGEDIPEVAVIK